MSSPEDHPLPALRASDADRDRTADRLRDHAVAGRLDPDELDGRLAAALSARTVAELEVLTRDLPGLPPDVDGPRAARHPAVAEARAELRARMLQQAGGALGITLLCTVIWLLTSGVGSHPWPVWVLLGTSAGVVGSSWRGLGPGGDPVAELERLRADEDD